MKIKTRKSKIVLLKANELSSDGKKYTRKVLKKAAEFNPTIFYDFIKGELYTYI